MLTDAKDANCHLKNRARVVTQYLFWYRTTDLHHGTCVRKLNLILSWVSNAVKGFPYHCTMSYHVKSHSEGKFSFKHLFYKSMGSTQHAYLTNRQLCAYRQNLKQHQTSSCKRAETQKTEAAEA